MICVNGVWLSATEALVQLDNLSVHSHKEFVVRCDSNISDKCRKEYLIEYRRYLKVLSHNDNCIRCVYCSHTLRYSGRNNPNTKYMFDDNYFSNIDTPEKAYLLGWIASDGHISIGAFCVAIHQKDIEILQLFQKFICKDIPIRIFTTPTSKLCSYTISSKQISSDICRHLQIKPRKKSDVVKFPNLPDDLVWHFIRGYFEGDGSVNDPNIAKFKHPKGHITSSSLSMLKSLKDICGGCICYNSNGCNSIDFSNTQMMNFLNNMYKSETNLRLSRKYNRYLSWVDYNNSKIKRVD